MSLQHMLAKNIHLNEMWLTMMMATLFRLDR